MKEERALKKVKGNGEEGEQKISCSGFSSKGSIFETDQCFLVSIQI